MRRSFWLGGAALALSSAILFAQDAPESLLPPGFDDPAPPKKPAPTPSPARPNAPSATAGTTSTPVIQAIPSTPSAPRPQAEQPKAALDKLPSMAEIEAMTPDELDELLGLKPKFDIPASARRSPARAGVIAPWEGGLPTQSLAKQPAALVRATLAGTRGPLVSRWGHILLRRALASRLDVPEGMDPAEFVALRAGLLNRIGESAVARALVQDVDTMHFNPALTDAAFDAYLATGDILGICPVARFNGKVRDDPLWQLSRQICAAYAGETASATSELNRAFGRGIAPAIDVLLAQRFAGAAGAGRRAVTIEWDQVKEMTPWRFGLSHALGIEIPPALTNGLGPEYDRSAVMIPAVPLGQRADAADVAGADGILSSSAMVDLYGQIFADGEVTGDAAKRAGQLREAYVAADPKERFAAMSNLWSSAARNVYGRQVLTAYAAARLPVTSDLEGRAGDLIASMLAAGLDRNAMRWANVVKQGSEGWALLSLAQPQRADNVSRGGVDDFVSDDDSPDGRKGNFFVAGLAGLGRISEGDINSLSSSMDLDLARESRWSRAIDRAAAVDNKVMVALLAGLGMQGDSWEKMTPRHLYHIVAALRKVGLDAEARMIAAEAVARG